MNHNIGFYSTAELRRLEKQSILFSISLLFNLRFKRKIYEINLKMGRRKKYLAEVNFSVGNFPKLRFCTWLFLTIIWT